MRFEHTLAVDRKKTPMKTHTNTLRIAASCAASLFLVPAVLHADDYTLAAGASETISTNATYGTMDIAGDLTIKNDKRVLATNAVNIVGGTVAITGNSAVFGHRANGHASLSTVVTFSPDGDGDYGKVTALRLSYTPPRGDWLNLVVERTA